MDQIFNTGPYGRTINVDASGALIISNGNGDYLPYAEGNTGRIVCVNASGALMVSLTGGAGESNTASNLGAGSQIFKSKVGPDLQFRTLTAGSGIALVTNTNDIQIKQLMLIAKPFKILSSSGTMTIDLAQFNNYYVALADNATVTFTNPTDGAKYLLVVKQAVGSKNMSFSNVLWVAGNAFAATATSGSVDFITLVWVSTLNKFLGQVGNDCK